MGYLTCEYRAFTLLLNYCSLHKLEPSINIAFIPEPVVEVNAAQNMQHPTTKTKSPLIKEM